MNDIENGQNATREEGHGPFQRLEGQKTCRVILPKVKRVDKIGGDLTQSNIGTQIKVGIALSEHGEHQYPAMVLQHAVEGKTTDGDGIFRGGPHSFIDLRPERKFDEKKDQNRADHLKEKVNSVGGVLAPPDTDGLSPFLGHDGPTAFFYDLHDEGWPHLVSEGFSKIFFMTRSMGSFSVENSLTGN